MVQALDHRLRVLTLHKHHLKNTVIKRLNHNRMSIYDIEMHDFNKHVYLTKCLTAAELYSYPVVLVMPELTRLLIFNRQ